MVKYASATCNYITSRKEPARASHQSLFTARFRGFATRIFCHRAPTKPPATQAKQETAKVVVG